MKQRLQDAGFDVSRFPSERAEHRRNKLLTAARISLVLDVGANVGEFGTELRRFGYRGRIISFEPLPSVYARLEQRAGSDPLWDSVRCALGRTAGTVELNVAANGGASSSVLPMLDRHREAAPNAAYIESISVQQRTLDEAALPLVQPLDRVLLKVDVQGYEHEVLAGASEVLSRCQAVQLELSLLPLYEGGLLYREVIALMDSLGFQLQWLQPGFSDPRSGQLLQTDGLFARAESSKIHRPYLTQTEDT